MLSFNNDPALKAAHVEQAEAHAAADMLQAGTYGQGDGASFRACSVGCFARDHGITGNLHAGLAEKFALPEWLWRLRDSMFEGLPQEDRASFHVEFSKRTPVGVDLEPVRHWLAIARIDRMLETQRKALEANHAHGVHEAIQQTIAALEVGRRAHEAAAGGNSCELSAARSAAWSAARPAAESAWSAARSAAESAAESAWKAERDALFAALDRAGAQ